MSLCLYDAKILGSTIKKARQKKHLTQAACAELLDFSLSFQKDVERGGYIRSRLPGTNSDYIKMSQKPATHFIIYSICLIRKR